MNNNRSVRSPSFLGSLYYYVLAVATAGMVFLLLRLSQRVVSICRTEIGFIPSGLMILYRTRLFWWVVPLALLVMGRLSSCCAFLRNVGG